MADRQWGGVKHGDWPTDHGRENMLRFVLGTLGAVALAWPVAAQVPSFPASFRTQDIQTATLVVMDAPIPGIPPWDALVRLPALWHFDFGGPDAERLVAGRERIYLDRFWNEFAGDRTKIDEATRAHYAQLYARPGAMRAAFAQFLAFPKDVAANKASMVTQLTMPVLT